MIAVTLVALAAVFGFGAPALMRRMTWPTRAPLLGVTTWISLVIATYVALIGAGITAAAPLLRATGGPREFFHRCPWFVAALLDHPGELALGALGVTCSSALAIGAALAAARQRRQFRDDGAANSALFVAHDRVDDVILLPHTRLAAWSVAVGPGQVVVTTAAAAALSPAELAAVIAHERAHLRGRHHHIVAAVQAAARAARCPLTRSAVDEVRALLEMRADDVATRTHTHASLTGALLRLSGIAPAGALGAGGGLAALRRLDRLEAPHRLNQWHRTGLLAVAAGVVTAPAVLILAELQTVLWLHFCPLPG